MHSVTEGITEEHLKDIYSDSYITKVGYDSKQAAPVIHPLVTYLTAWVDGIFSGAFIVIKYTQYEFEVHALLKKSSIKHSRELGNKCIEWMFSHPSVLRVTAYVIEGLEMAKNYCLKLGFKHEGTRRNACMQDGVIRDVYVLGMTREDWSVL